MSQTDSRPSTRKRILAEGFGTFALVIMETGPAAIGGFDPASQSGRVAIALSAGFVIAAMVYMTGEISGAHVNPAVTLGYLAASPFPPRRYRPAACRAVRRRDPRRRHRRSDSGRCAARNGAPSSRRDRLRLARRDPPLCLVGRLPRRDGGDLRLRGAVPDRSPRRRIPRPSTGWRWASAAAALHLAIAGVSGGSLNPARSLGPALFAGSDALSQLWLYLAAPILGAMLAGLFTRALPLFRSQG